MLKSAGVYSPADFLHLSEVEESLDVHEKPENPRRRLWLLISLLVILIASPFVVRSYYEPVILNGIAAIVLLSATYALNRRRSFFIFLLP